MFALHPWTLALFKSAANGMVVTLQSQTFQISQILLSTFEFPIPRFRQETSSLPEVLLMCFLIIAVKVYHPFDSFARHARSFADPAALTFDWETWVNAQKSNNVRATGESHLERGSEINVTEKDVMNMTGDQLDDYMDWYERTFIDESRAEEKARGLPKQLLDMFPIGRPDGSSPTPYDHTQMATEEQETIDSRLKMVVGKLRLRTLVSHDPEDSVETDTHSTPLGSFYKRYRNVEDLTPHAKAFHEAVAAAIGVRLKTLVVAVGQVERKLVKWRDAKVKADKDKGDEVMKDTSDQST